MKRLLCAAALAVIAAPATAEVGVSVTVGQPGFYGRIDIGGFPAPRLVFPEPVLIEHVHVVGPPVYLHVPPGHAKNWAAHCHAYGACAQRVFFVQDAWYNDVYVPAYHERHGGGKPGHPGGGKPGGGKPGGGKPGGSKGHGKGHKH